MRAKVCFFDPKITLFFFFLDSLSCFLYFSDRILFRCTSLKMFFFFNYSDLYLNRFFGLCSSFSIYCLCCFFFSVRFPAIFCCFRVCMLCSFELFFFNYFYNFSFLCEISRYDHIDFSYWGGCAEQNKGS